MLKTVENMTKYAPSPMRSLHFSRSFPTYTYDKAKIRSIKKVEGHVTVTEKHTRAPDEIQVQIQIY